MKHEEFEKQMFDGVNRNCRMKELDRQEVARAAEEEYRVVRKCKKINTVVCIIVLIACFATTVFAVQVMNLTGFVSSAVAIAVMALVGLMFGMGINYMGNRIKN